MQRHETERGYRLEERLGKVEFSRASPDLAYFVFEGALTGVVLPTIHATLDEIIAEHGQLAMFVDAAELASYTTDFRKDWTTWLKANRPKLRRVDVLIRSAVARMGLSIINPLVGNFIRAHPDREAFDEALAAERG